MVQIYQNKWERGYLKSLIGYLRDSLVLLLPIKRLPQWAIKLLYGLDAKFAFLVHPRVYQDVFISAPYLKPVKMFLRKDAGYKFAAKTNPFVLNTVQTQQGVHGFVIAQLTVPEIMFEQRKKTMAMLEKSLLLASKICLPGAVAGLGGWFPMVSRRGAALKGFAEINNITITNGHCGTLASIFMTVAKVMHTAGIPQSEITLAVVGVGKMGLNVAKAFNGRVKKLVLIDVNENGLRKASAELTKSKNHSELEVVISSSDTQSELRDALRKSTLGVFATSSVRNLLKLRDLPDGFIGIDDSRPEALPRDPKNERIVLEGGLLKIKNATIDYNYGFGEDDNVFGCLGEAFLLALNQTTTLQPTLGEVDMDNFFKLLEFCQANNVSEGDLKSSQVYISDNDIREAFVRRGFIKTTANKEE